MKNGEKGVQKIALKVFVVVVRIERRILHSVKYVLVTIQTTMRSVCRKGCVYVVGPPPMKGLKNVWTVETVTRQISKQIG